MTTGDLRFKINNLKTIIGCYKHVLVKKPNDQEVIEKLKEASEELRRIQETYLMFY